MTTMVDSKIGKTFQRSVGRAKEKLLQNLGKVDRTADEILDEQIGNFNKQQGAATRLQKELNNYIRCIRACAAASRGLLESVGEVYEPEWGGKELLSVNAQSVELLWNDFAHRLAEQVLIPLNTYQGQFPEMRKKIEKRSRKLIDFDGERHALQALQANPRRAEAKLAKQREGLEAAKRTYEVLNMELHEELPSLYNSRIVFLVSAMSTLFASENIFHTETSKVFTEMEGIVERLSKESAKGNLNFKVPSNAIMNHSGADSPKDVKGGNTSTAPDMSNNCSTSSKASSPVSVSPTSRPTSLNMSTTTTTTTYQNGEDHNLTSNPSNKLAEGSNHVITSNGNTTPTITESPITSLHTNGIKENGIESKSETTTPTETMAKMVNGGAGDGESSAPSVTTNKDDTTPASTGVSATDPGKMTANGHSDKVVVGGTIDETSTDSNTNSTPTLDANNNDTLMTYAIDGKNKKVAKTLTDNDTTDVDASPSNATSLPNGAGSNKKDIISDKKMDKVAEVVDDIEGKSDKESKNGVETDDLAAPTATAPLRGVNKPLHGILSQSKHANANGELSEESPAKDKNNSPGDSTKEPGVLYKVRATYRYQKEDVDELSFEAGEIIRVIEYEEPEEQEEGWLMGYKENGEKGLFPANFTRPI